MGDKENKRHSKQYPVGKVQFHSLLRKASQPTKKSEKEKS